MIDSSVVPQSRFSPLAGNQFKTRDDVQAAVHSLFNPLLSSFSEGRARVQLDASGFSHDRAASDLEGFARPLFGIAPLVAGDGEFQHWELYREGLKNGTDPLHREYWGAVACPDQRQVEMAAIGYALYLAPEHIWEPLDDSAKKNVATYLLHYRNSQHVGNNHMFFRVMVDLGLEKVGVPLDRSMAEEYLQRLEKLHIEDGWYRDGNDASDDRRIDYYNPFALHFYGLLCSTYRLQSSADRERATRFRERGRKFAQHFQHWFADTGANVPFGRSLTYRTAVAGFWGALAVANEEALPWGVIKGLYLRNLRWWAALPIARSNDGVLTVGYAYPNSFMSERYNSSGSPWWAMKAFAPLSLPASHPFWAAEELPLPARDATAGFQVPGMVFSHQPGHTIMFAAGFGSTQLMRHVSEKYKKFAYSSRYGFSVENESQGFEIGTFDSMIAFSDDGRHFRMREYCDDAYIAGDALYSLWHPWKDVKVETWLVPRGQWHVRVHRITSPRALSTIEGGFAAPRTDFNADEKNVEGRSAWVKSTIGDFSGIVDVSSKPRSARVNIPHGNTSVMFPRTLVPQLRGEVEVNSPTVFACAVLAHPDGTVVMNSAWDRPPSVPSVDELEKLFKAQGVQVGIVRTSQNCP